MGRIIAEIFFCETDDIVVFQKAFFLGSQRNAIYQGSVFRIQIYSITMFPLPQDSGMYPADSRHVKINIRRSGPFSDKNLFLIQRKDFSGIFSRVFDTSSLIL